MRANLKPEPVGKKIKKDCHSREVPRFNRGRTQARRARTDIMASCCEKLMPHGFGSSSPSSIWVPAFAGMTVIFLRELLLRVSACAFSGEAETDFEKDSRRGAETRRFRPG